MSEPQYLTMDSTKHITMGTSSPQGHYIPSPAPFLPEILRGVGALLVAGLATVAFVGTDPKLLLAFAPTIAALIFITKVKPRFLMGAAFVLVGGLLVFNFGGVLSENLPLLISAVAFFAGGALFFSKGTSGAAVWVVLLTMAFGLGGWVANAKLSQTGITGVYDPIEEDRAVFLFTEPCFIVDDGSGGVHVVPSGRWGVYPEHPSPRHVGKMVGGSRIIGIVEKGGAVNIYNPGGESVSVLDFSFVTPAGGDKGATVVSGLF